VRPAPVQLRRFPRRTSRWLRPLVLVAFAGLVAGCGASTIPSVHSETERLDQGRRALAKHEYNVALELLRSYVTNNAGGADVDQAIELLGESHLRIKDWAEAQSQFERVLRDYPESDSAAAASFHLGEALWGQSRGPAFDQEFTQRALEQWESYLRSYPGHWQNEEARARAQRARERLAIKLADAGWLYLKLERAGPARVYFQRVLDEYPDSAVATDALLGLAVADARSGKRAEGEAALRDLVSRFSGRPVAERAARELARLERQDAKKKK
jgi:outer membrane protein assembly factor BamD